MGTTLKDPVKTPPVEIAFRTDPGRDPDKQVNEDAAFHAETTHGLLAVVCDGMGGHAGGKEASELATKTILEIVSAAPAVTTARDALRFAIEEANRRVWSMPTDERGYRPGSTVVAVLAHMDGAEVAHVGDSRVYLVHGGAIAQITKDHSMVQEMVDRNIIRAEDAAAHPDANKIMRALGIAKDVEVDVRPEPVLFTAGDVFVLCSDGLSDLVTAPEILEIVGSRSAAQAAGQLVDLANARGGHDNITAMVLQMKGSASASLAPTVVKTVALTAHEASPVSVAADRGSGPRGTVMTAPMTSVQSTGTALQAPLVEHGVRVASQEESVPPGERRGRLVAMMGVVLGVVALAVGGWFLWQQSRPKPAHRVAPLVLPQRESSPAPDPQTQEEPAPDITLAPVLAPPSGVKVPWWKDADASPPSGEPRDCAIARWQKEHGRPASSYEPLEAKCRAAGGKL